MKNDIAKITSLISEDFNVFENELKKIIESSDDFLRNDLYNFVFKNAKFLRPRLVILFSKILNTDDFNVINVALALELVHNASLIHDDIIDGSRKRRDTLTFNIKFDSKTAVLAGDLLLAGALNILSKTNSKIIKIFSDRIFKTIRGELKQNQNFEKIMTLEEYLDKTFSKTANLFLTGLESLYVLMEETGGELSYIKEQLKNYIINFSYAFQIQNDIKDVKSDFKNGNYTLPLIYYFEENEKTKNYNEINLEKYILKAKNMVKFYKNNAKSAIADIENKYKHVLEELVDII